MLFKKFSNRKKLWWVLGAIILIIIVGFGAFWLHTISEPYTTAGPFGVLFPAPYKKATTTVFWVGEGATSDNDYISNTESAWDEHWAEHYGGVDSPNNRCGSFPCGFVPKENPFYAALPYDDWDDNGDQRPNAKLIPWYSPDFPKDHSLMKNHWIEIRQGQYTCYAQIEDVGPYEENDFGYVFGNNPTPKNQIDLKAGLDVSPAVRDCLHIQDGSAQTYWRFVDANDVPPGAWRMIVTTSY
ncbi:MAG TPA: hypothetical protein VFM02_03065 [Candidatus Paceibacterota bacterium]|nr:hypothetical protein [Candidatus Paceibacterota bacterium]